MKKPSIFILAVIAAGAVALMGCTSAKPFKYHSGTEIPEGPGLFSKEKGEITIYDSEKGKTESKEKSDRNATSVDNAGAGDPTAVDNSEEFQQFKQWQDDQKEFQAFLEWKKSQRNSEEYKEFQEWRRWKAYKQWQAEQQKSK